MLSTVPKPEAFFLLRVALGVRLKNSREKLTPFTLFFFADNPFRPKEPSTNDPASTLRPPPPRPAAVMP
jgi:hypothetical protein